MRSWCFDSQESGGVYDREYGSADIREVVYKIVGNGVYATPTTNMQVVADTGMTISVQPGSCWVNGAYGCIDAAEDLTIDISSSGRVDLIVARFDLSLSYRSIRLAVIKGTEGSGTAPTPTQTALVYDLQLAKINVRASAASILQSDITDTRYDSSVCGIVTGVAYQAAALQDQIDDLDTAKQDKTNSLATETVLDDADSLPFYDASATAHKKTLWSNIKAKLKAYFDPLYVEIVWLESTASLTAPGDSTKFYVTGNDNNIWHWNGSKFIIISPTLMLGEIDTRAYRGDRGKIAYDHSQLTSGNPHGTTKTDIGLGLCDNTPDANKIVSTPQQEALDLKADIDKMFYPDNQYGGIISSNLDTIAVTGSYTCYNTATGAPFADSSAFVFHQNSNAGTVSAWQLGLAYTDGRILFRFKRSSAWTAWEKLTADQIGLIDSGGNFDATTAEDALAELATEKANKVQEDYIVPTLLNGYEAYSATTTPKYYKDEFGIVRMKGWLKTGVAGNAAFILQSGYRPSGYPFFPAAQGGSVNPTRIRISDTGEATPSAYSSYICLDGISFRAE